MNDPLNRRRFLGQSAALLPLAAVPAAALAVPDDPVPGLIVRESEPRNLEMNSAALDSFVTPTERFYVRNHFAQPPVDGKTWRLKVEGAVERPLELSFDEVRQLPTKALTCTLECAGNGRVFLLKARGVQWAQGAVGNAEWTGVPLAAVLERAGVKPSAVEVILEGADQGTVATDPQSPGPIHFARSVPLELLKEREVLLAHTMNGQPLTPAHGFPLRAVVPGWYGMASVKWLTRLVVTTQPFRGFWQTFDYSYFERVNGLPVLTPITTIDVKSVIARPVEGAVVPADKPYTIRGAAWSGGGPVTRVEVSTDGGKTWAQAKLVGPGERYAWRLWEYPWNPGRAGRAVLMARATDAQGRTQPMQRDPDRRTYMVSHVLPVAVEVR